MNLSTDVAGHNLGTTRGIIGYAYALAHYADDRATAHAIDVSEDPVLAALAVAAESIVRRASGRLARGRRESRDAWLYRLRKALPREPTKKTGARP